MKFLTNIPIPFGETLKILQDLEKQGIIKTESPGYSHKTFEDIPNSVGIFCEPENNQFVLAMLFPSNNWFDKKVPGQEIPKFNQD